jgi:DNA-binding NarL/FixJ family response regulator
MIPLTTTMLLSTNSPDYQAIPQFSDKELSIIQYIADGCQQKQIAHFINQHPHHIETVLSGIYKKLKCSNAPSMVSQCYKLGILTLENRSLENVA